MNAQLVPKDDNPPALTTLPAASTTPSQLLALAVQQGADLDRLERLMALQERWEANEARKAYVAAMASFKAEPLTIVKDKHVSFTTQKGKTEYDHATLGNVVRTIVAGLAKHGLSHSWQTERMEGGRVQVTCRITHQLGHSESIALDAPLDDSGGKNNIQALGSAITYLQRYTLLAITGLATEDGDDDGDAFDPRVLYDATLDELDAVADSKRKAWHDELAAKYSESIAHIKDRIASDDIAAAVAEWQQFSQDEQRGLWLAPSKGGCFTTRERELIRKHIGANANTTGAGND